MIDWVADNFLVVMALFFALCIGCVLGEYSGRENAKQEICGMAGGRYANGVCVSAQVTIPMDRQQLQ